MNFNTCIIDGDPLIYRCGFSIESYDKELEILKVEPVKHALYNINSMMKKILSVTGCQNYQVYLTSNDKSNFRFDLFSAYKSNRKDARKPVHYDKCREFMVRKWGAEIIYGQEADDKCSIEHCKLNRLGWDPEIKSSIVCSFDKDFNNIPGWHYNYVKDEVYYVNEKEALQNFYLQILTGDASDGIPRIGKGWKKKECEKKIKDSKQEEEMREIVIEEINKLNPRLNKEESNQVMINRARLVWLRREEEEMWTPKN